VTALYEVFGSTDVGWAVRLIDLFAFFFVLLYTLPRLHLSRWRSFVFEEERKAKALSCVEYIPTP
jgi:hypothetical protein